MATNIPWIMGLNQWRDRDEVIPVTQPPPAPVDPAGSGGGTPPPAEGTGGVVAGAAVAGAVIPISYSLPSLTGTVRYVSPTGVGGAPFSTPQAAINAANSGDSIVLRGGTYPISSNPISVPTSKTGLMITAYPGETPYFDGSQKITAGGTVEGSYRWYSYTPMPAKTGEGINLENLQTASFDGSGNPTGKADLIGWASVDSTGETYQIPATQNKSSLGSGDSARIITGLYPDQVWVDGVAYTQVFTKANLGSKKFWVSRVVSDDTSPQSRQLYLWNADTTGMSDLRVSKSNGTFIIIGANNTTLRGIKIFGHSQNWGVFPIQIQAGTANVKLIDVSIDSCAAVSVKWMGGAGTNFSGTAIIKSPLIERLTVTRAGWIGVAGQYTDDATIISSRFDDINWAGEFQANPKSGAIKVTKTLRTKVEKCIFRRIDSHGIWFDQSNYDVTYASNYMSDVSNVMLFFEISHKLLLVNNLFIRGATTDSDPSVVCSGGSGATIVNNTIVGGPMAISFYADYRGQYYTGTRTAAEHTERYNKGGSFASDLSPAPSSDLDKARAGAYGNTLSPTRPNLTPDMNWFVGTVYFVNNILANPNEALRNPADGGGYPFFANTSNAEAATTPTMVFPTGVGTMDGNIYQDDNKVALVKVKGGTGAITAETLAEWKGTSGLGSSYYNRTVETKGLSGTGWVEASGKPTAALVAKQGAAQPVKTDTSLNRYIAAGTKIYGAMLLPPGGW